MKTGWKVLIAAGVVLTLVSGQVLAQPGGNGPGWGPGPGAGPGGPAGLGMGLHRYGPGQGGPQGGPRAWQPRGAGAWGRGAWSPQDRGPAGMGGLLSGRLGLTDEQRQKVRAILDKAHAKTMAAIREVLTDEQIRQLEQMRGRGGQFGGRMRGPGPREGFGNPLGGRHQWGAGPGAGMFPRGRGRPGPAFRGGQGQGPAPRFQMGPQQPGSPEQPFAGRRGPGAGRGWNRGNQPGEQMFNGPDANQQGRRPQGNAGPGAPMSPRGRGRPGQPFRGGQGQGPDSQSQMGPQQPGSPDQPSAGPRGPGAGRLSNRGNPSLEQIFDQADANKDGTLTKEEIRAFQEAREATGRASR